MTVDKFQEHRQFVMNIEHAIKLANREVLNQIILPLNEEKVIAVAVEVAKARGAYLKALLNTHGEADSSTNPLELKKLRQAYEELREGFAALMTVFDRDYVDIPANDHGEPSHTQPIARTA